MMYQLKFQNVSKTFKCSSSGNPFAQSIMQVQPVNQMICKPSASQCSCANMCALVRMC